MAPGFSRSRKLSCSRQDHSTVREYRGQKKFWTSGAKIHNKEVRTGRRFIFSICVVVKGGKVLFLFWTKGRGRFVIKSALLLSDLWKGKISASPPPPLFWMKGRGRFVIKKCSPSFRFMERKKKSVLLPLLSGEREKFFIFIFGREGEIRNKRALSFFQVYGKEKLCTSLTPLRWRAI